MPLKKPLIDERAFQQVRLSNGIAVTLISDKRSEKSSCALSIGFGAAKDSLPGLAHMTEHAVFLGSEKYPEENAYKKFLNKNGGGSNGATGMEYTLYKFYVNSESFEGALDIFAQFFKSPLLAADSIKREVHAVDSEDSKNRNLDNRRALQVLKDIMDLGISYSKYSTGNLNTLVFGSVEEHGDILVQSVQDFHRQHYLPGKMNLCLVGPQSLQELERLATTVFSDISNPTDNSGHSEEGKSSLAGDTPSHSSGVFMGEDVQQSSLVVQLRPAKDIRDISFMWTLPFVKEQYRSDPAPLITYLLNQGEEGTLLATLQDLGLATAVSGSYRTTFTDPNEYKSFAVYEVSASLTEEGLRQWPVVRQYIMQSLQQIASLSEDQARQYWEEIQAISTLSFAFQSQPSAYEQAASAAYNMLDYHLDDVLCAVNVTRLHRPSRFICRNLLERVRREPQVFQEQLVSRKLFSSPPSVVSLHIPPSPTATVAVQEDGEATTIVPRENEEENASYGTPPPTITTTAVAAASMWISRDEVFCTPKSMLHVFVPRLVPPHITSNVHPRNALYNTLLDQVISREFWDAYAAGLSADVSWSRRGLSLKFRGYSEGLFPFAQLICHQLLGHVSSPLDDDAQQQQQQQGHGFGRGRYGVRGFEVRVLSKRFDPSDIEHAVEGFVQRQVASLHSNGGTVLDSDVVAIAKSIITTLRDPPTSYAEEANEFWSSITSEFPFDWQDRVIAELETIHLADVQDFVATYIASPSSRKSIAVHIYGSVPEATAKREAFLDAVQRGEKVFLGAPMQALSTVDEISSWRTALPWSTKTTSF
eukprot:gene1998-1454_t